MKLWTRPDDFKIDKERNFLGPAQVRYCFQFFVLNFQNFGAKRKRKCQCFKTRPHIELAKEEGQGLMVGPESNHNIILLKK